MSTEKRKIGFYIITLIDKQTEAPLKADQIRPILNYIEQLNPEEKIFDIPASNKFHFLDQIQNVDSFIQNLIFKSAKHHHRPPLINRLNATERDNPKTLEEGERELTHITFYYERKEIIVLLEERKVGISIGTLIRYLEHYGKKYFAEKSQKMPFRLEYSIIPKGDFLEQLDKLKRVNFGSVYIEKRLLGSDALNFSNRLEQVQEEIEIIIKAKRKKNISDTIREIINKFISSDGRIKRVKVIGYSEEGNQVLLDTALIKKKEYIYVALDKNTGTVNSTQIFNNFIVLINEFLDIYLSKEA